MAFSFQPKVVSDGLIFAVDAANNKSYPGSGTTWTDLSSTQITGSLTNGPTFNSANGGSIVFDGSNDYFSTSDAALPSGTSARTIQYFFNVSSISQTNMVTYGAPGNKTGASNGQMYATLIQSSKITFSAYGSTYNFSSISNVVTGRWYNVAFVFNGSTHLMYINGIYDNAGSVGFSTVLDGQMTIGARRDGNATYTEYFNGRIAQVYIYNRALSASEVLQNYNALKGRFNLT